MQLNTVLIWGVLTKCYMMPLLTFDDKIIVRQIVVVSRLPSEVQRSKNSTRETPPAVLHRKSNTVFVTELGDF